MLHRLINNITESMLAESQCGFRKNRSTIDMIFTARQLQEKFGCPNKFLNILRQFHDGMTARVSIGGQESEPFLVHTGVRQGRLHATKKLCRERVLELQYSDDCAFVAHTPEDLQTVLVVAVRAYSRIELTVNSTKTEVVCQWSTNVPPTLPAFTVRDEHLSVVPSFKYLGSILAEDCGIDNEIQNRIKQASVAFGRLQRRVFHNKNLHPSTKLAVYQAVCVTTLLYSCEAWVTYSRHIRSLEHFHISCLQRILGVTWRDQCYTASYIMVDVQLGGPKKRYKDQMKNTLKKCKTRPEDLEDVAADQCYTASYIMVDVQLGGPKKRYKDQMKNTLKKCKTRPEDCVVEACVLHGLKRRAAGFLRSNKLTALFMKVGKMFPPAEELCRKVQELEQIIENKQNQGQMSQESVRKQPRPLSLSPLAIKHLWIRTALTQKLLDKIVLYLVENSSKFYEREALLRDPVDGPILASLLVGPCALEYTKAKTANHFWTDPSADELVQRHRIHSGHCRQDSPTKRPALIQKRQSSGSMDDRPSLWARDYVESLHQNSRATLLFGKNNVLVQPTDDMEAIPGYLSLHQTADLMTLKWTPNQLMNGNMGEFDYEKRMIVNMMLIDFLDAKVVPELMDQTVNLWQPAPRKSSCSSCSQNGSSDGGLPNGCNHDRAPLKLLCETMKHQIISRAFYGWLAYCRQLSTVRTHLSALVNPAIIEPDLPYNARGGLSADVWKTFLQDSTAYEEEALLRLVYYGGVEPSLRKEVWPFLLGHYHFSMSLAERKEVDEQIRACYEQTMSEWLGCEAIVRQREKEQHAAALAKCASGASVDRGLRQDSTISTDSSQTSSSSSDKQSHAGSHSQSNSSTQVFGSVDEADPIESEPKPKDEKPQPKIPNGALPNCTSSPDSGHPSSRNFSVTSALSDCSPSTEETSTQESGPKSAGQGPPSGDQTDEKTKEERPENRSTTQDTVKEDAVDSHTESAASEAAIKPLESDKLQTSNAEESSRDIESEDANSKNAAEMKNSARKSEENDTNESKDPVEDTTKSTESKDPRRASSPSGEENTKSKTDPKLALKVDEGQDADFESLDILKISQTDENKPVALGKHTSEPQNVTQTQNEAETISRDADHSRTRSIIRQMTESESESCGPITSLSKQSPDMSDDSPSALEMEEIASSVVYMSSESSVSRTPLILARPVAPALELCMEPGVNTSPEGTDSALSEEEPEMDNLFPKPDSLAVTGDKNDIASPVSSIGTTYSQELVDLYTLNLHRIDKDVQRCDRNFWYFTPANLEKLRNIMCSYVWQHLDIGYVQGMCDLLAPLLVILDDEAMAFSCFTELMKRMNQNFPHGGAMDTHFANMRSLIQILDSELFELMQQNGDYTHFYFCYRWFLLDFKREMVYDDVFSVWETVWAARYASSEHFVLFIALALVELYRDIILENNMDFTDIIKFFNEMAERHDIPKLLLMARELVHKVQILIENK
ncbi:small G protein signaling modulator 1-like [Sinocyclocheilus grahami]|uniref:small G protein signaling modulator 1-like n=1 Tax=Sinocyclocheilus grahami TaxID=75366 RepID=UPI0007AD2DBB|nr:PREDICTED: small G protein signaling modulator 1-like [Sinocyclocheilus grahami]